MAVAYPIQWCCCGCMFQLDGHEYRGQRGRAGQTWRYQTGGQALWLPDVGVSLTQEGLVLSSLVVVAVEFIDLDNRGWLLIWANGHR